MELTGKLKEKVDKSESREEAKEAIKDAGIILNDAELDSIAGGIGVRAPSTAELKRQKDKSPL